MQAPSIDPTIIAALGAMQGTLGGQTSLQAQQDQEQQGVVDQANQAAQAASQAYQGAAAQPTPDLGPMAGFIPTLFGNTASIISGNPEYARQGHETVVQRQKDLADARLSNLQALRDQFDQKARAAEQLGNTEMANEARMKQEQFSKAMEAILQQQQSDLTGKREKDLETQRQAGRMDLEKYKIAHPAPSAKEKDKIDPNLFQKAVITTSGGQKGIEITKFTGDQRQQATEFALQNDLPILDANEGSQLRDIQTARLGIDTVFNKIKRLLPADAAQRASQYGPRKMSELLQTSAQRAAYKSLWGTAIRLLRAQAGSKSFRMTRSEIDRAVGSDIPTLNDTFDTASQKLQNANDLLNNAETPIVTRNWSKSGAGSSVSANPLDPNTKSQALKADEPTFIKIVSEHPELRSDPEIVAQARKLKSARRP
jgi:hypothetical protein